MFWNLGVGFFHHCTAHYFSVVSVISYHRLGSLDNTFLLVCGSGSHLENGGVRGHTSDFKAEGSVFIYFRALSLSIGCAHCLDPGACIHCQSQHRCLLLLLVPCPHLFPLLGTGSVKDSHEGMGFTDKLIFSFVSRSLTLVVFCKFPFVR